jgi:type II secretory pathway component GspD/PulD (secretin)
VEEVSPPAQEPFPDLDDLLPPGRTVSLELPEASLGEVLRLLANAGDLNLVVAEGIDLRVSITLKDVTLQDAIRTVARRFDLRVARMGSVLFVEPAAGPSAVVSRAFRLESADVAKVAEALRTILSGGGEVVVDEENRTVFLRGDPARVAEAVAFLASADRREQQVVIEARIYEVGFEKDFELGSAVDLLDISLDDTTGALLSNFLTPATNFTFAWSNDAGTIAATVRALDRIASVDLLSAPRVSVLDGKEAKIEIVQKVPYVQATTTFDVASGGSTTATLQSIQYEIVGITLKCTAEIRDDGLVRLAVTPEVSNIRDFIQGVPVVDRRTLTTEVFVRDGGTLFLGGLLQETEREEVNRVPILGSIPLLGALFRSTERVRVKANLLVLLTPRIVDPEAVPPGVTEEFRQEYDATLESTPGIRRESR